jgi:hypothetical protein
MFHGAAKQLFKEKEEAIVSEFSSELPIIKRRITPGKYKKNEKNLT